MTLKQIIIGYSNQMSLRSIAKHTGISCHTVGRYLRWFQDSSYTMEDVQKMDHGTLQALFLSSSLGYQKRYETLLPYLEQTHPSQNDAGFTLRYHYEPYARVVDHPYHAHIRGPQAYQ